MSLDYGLRIATDLPALETLELLSKELPMEWGKDSRLLSPGLVAGAIPENERRQAFMQSLFGFTPTVNVWFRLDTRDNYEQGKHTLLIASVTLLTHIPGDAVLLFNGETIVLQRIAGTLIFNKDLGAWPESQLAEIELPYYIEPLPSPLLSDELPSIPISNGIHARLKSIAVRQGKSVTEIANETLEAYLNSQSHGTPADPESHPQHSLA